MVPGCGTYEHCETDLQSQVESMNQKLMFVDEVPFTGLADEWVSGLDLLKWRESEITVVMSGAVPEVPANRKLGVVVAVQVDAVDVAN